MMRHDGSQAFCVREGWIGQCYYCIFAYIDRLLREFSYTTAYTTYMFYVSITSRIVVLSSKTELAYRSG